MPLNCNSYWTFVFTRVTYCHTILGTFQHCQVMFSKLDQSEKKLSFVQDGCTLYFFVFLLKLSLIFSNGFKRRNIQPTVKAHPSSERDSVYNQVIHCPEAHCSCVFTWSKDQYISLSNAGRRRLFWNSTQQPFPFELFRYCQSSKALNCFSKHILATFSH